MAEIKCFMLEPTDRTRRYLRRMISFKASPEERACKVAEHGYHQARQMIEAAPAILARRVIQTDNGVQETGDPIYIVEEQPEHFRVLEYVGISGYSGHQGLSGYPTCTVDKDTDIFSGKEDPRWPWQCRCGYKFTPDDIWQVFTNLIYKRKDTDELMTLQEAPPGAMWDADWMHDLNEYYGSDHRGDRLGDGLVLVVKTPGGEWIIDGPSSDKPAKRWSRSGTPPHITVQGSIGIGSPQRYHGMLIEGVLRDV